MMKRSPVVKPRWSPSSISRSWNCYQSTWNVSRGISVKPLWVKSMDSWGYFMGFHGELMRISPSTDGDIPWIFGHQIWADDNSPGWQVAPTDNGDMEACLLDLRYSVIEWTIPFSTSTKIGDATSDFLNCFWGDMSSKGPQGGLTHLRRSAEDSSSRESAMLVDGRVAGMRSWATARHHSWCFMLGSTVI